MASSLAGNRDFQLLWSGQALSSIGTQVSGVALPLLVLAETGSPARAGIVGFAQTLPVTLLALPAGALADRCDRRAVLLGANLVRALALAAVVLALALGHAPYGLLIALAVVQGGGFVVAYVTERGVLRRMVPADQLSDAVARNEARTFGAALAGPPLGGLVYGIARVVPFLVDGISYLVSTITLLLIRTPFQDERTEPASGGVREGLTWLWERPFPRACMLLFAGSNPVFAGLALLVVVLARRHGAPSGLIGVMLGIASAGGLAGALLAPTLQRRLTARQSLVAETWVLTCVLPLMIVAHNAVLLGLIFAAAELLTPVSNSIVVSYRVAHAPDRLQGRVQAAATLVSFSFGWAGPLLVGALLSGVGASATVWTLTGWMLLLALGASSAPALRHLEPAPSA